MRLAWLHILTVFAVLVSAQPQHARAQEDGSAKVVCPARATNIRLYQQVLKSQIKSRIDPEKYTAPKIRVALKLVRADPQTHTDYFEDITYGLTLDQQALSFSASGSFSYALSCEFTYRVSIQVIATDIATGARLKATTESIVTLISSGEGVVREIIAPSPTPSPEATATPTPTPEGSEPGEGEEE